MPVLLYCLTLPRDSVSVAAGVGDVIVQSHESSNLRYYWSEVPNPEASFGDSESLKRARSQFQQVLRQILSATTPLPFPFPTLLESVATAEDYVGAKREIYCSALERIGDAAQYEIVATWAADDHTDLSAPISGREYAKRRQEALTRVAVVDSKLKGVTSGSALEWRARKERRAHRWFALVPRNNRERFVASLRNAGPSEGVRLRLTGPWPPSEFITPDNSAR